MKLSACGVLKLAQLAPCPLQGHAHAGMSSMATAIHGIISSMHMPSSSSMFAHIIILSQLLHVILLSCKHYFGPIQDRHGYPCMSPNHYFGPIQEALSCTNSIRQIEAKIQYFLDIRAPNRVRGVFFHTFGDFFGCPWLGFCVQ